MKKLMLIAALAVVSTAAFAQKTEEASQKAVAAAQAACNDAKKATKLATWMNAAKVNLEAYIAPQGVGMVGVGRAEITMLLNDKKPVETVTRTVAEKEYLVDVFTNADYYYQNDILQFIVTTRPYVENALETALNAYSKATELDVKGAKTKEIMDGINKISTYYQNEALNAYNFREYAQSSALFQKAFEAAITAPLSKIDTSIIYNAGLTAFMAGDMPRTEVMMKECLKYNYYEKGEVFAKLAECQKAQKDTIACKQTLEAGFEKCPENQGILVGLINLYLDTKDDPEKLFSLLDVAKKNEPNNASLYYVEGNIRKQLGQFDEAAAAYDKCAEVNPAYEYGFIGKGLLYAEQADKIGEKAEREFNDAKYQILVEQFNEVLDKAIGSFETAFGITKDNQLKLSLASYLKSWLYRLRDKDDAHKAAYEKYDEIVKTGEIK